MRPGLILSLVCFVVVGLYALVTPFPKAWNVAVVDTNGQVHGTDRLSVIDASIVPNGPSAFTHIPVVMIAERLSEQLARLI